MNIIDTSQKFLKDQISHSHTSIKYLEGVAGMRFALREFGSLLYTFSSEQEKMDQEQLQFVQLVKDVCTDATINTTNFSEGDIVGPAIYLIKVLVRQYGLYFLHQVVDDNQWIVPEALRSQDQVCISVLCQ